MTVGHLFLLVYHNRYHQSIDIMLISSENKQKGSLPYRQLPCKYPLTINIIPQTDKNVNKNFSILNYFYTPNISYSPAFKEIDL